MSMNSFSFKAEKKRRRSRRETDTQTQTDVSQLLDLHPEGATSQSKEASPPDLNLQKYEWQDPMGRRKTPRYELNLTVLISNHRKAFRSQTLNLSSGGLLLKDLLPEEFSQHPFDILMIHTTVDGEKLFFLVRGRALPGRLRGRQIQFESLGEGCESRLLELFEGLPAAA